jgi:hypothetical protein
MAQHIEFDNLSDSAGREHSMPHRQRRQLNKTLKMTAFWGLLGWLIGATGILYGPPVMAESSPWLTVQGRALFNGKDKSRARDLAMEDAQREAVYQALAKDISLEDLFVSLRLSGSMLGAIPCGVIAESQVLKESVVPAPEPLNGEARLEYRVTLKARVSECPTQPSTDFKLTAKLNQVVFADGDPMSLTLSASRDCYYYIFNILEDERVLRLVPNRLKKDNFIAARTHGTFPNDADTRKGIHLIAHTPPKVTQTTEEFYILALRQPVDLSTEGIQEGFYDLFDGHTAFIQTLIRRIVTIPTEERAEQLVRYQIETGSQSESSEQ